MTEPTGYTSLGMIGYSDKGNYDATATYVANDIVHYNGAAWKCKVDDTTAVTPAEGANWTLFIAGAAPFIGATASADGVEGVVPKPEAGEEGKYLRGDGDWSQISTPEVSFDNTGTGMSATSADGAIKELNAALTDIFKAIYPVGSIYMSTDSANPGTKFTGTTWVAWGSGRVPVGVDSSDTSFDSVEETGGSKTESYTPAGSNTAVTLTAAQSGVPAHSHGLNNHVHSVGAHKHGLNSHTHSIPALSGTTGNQSTGHTHPLRNSVAAGVSYGLTSGSAFAGNVVTTTSSGASSWANTNTESANHTHNVTTTASTTGGATGNTADSAAFNTGQATGSTADNTAKNAASSHNHTFTGTAASISHLQPYITCYMWKRTA